MPRQPRAYSKSKIYHIMYKGIDSQDIFYEDKDKIFFLQKLLENKREYKYSIYAYCLMSNHVHIVLNIDDAYLSNAMKSLSVKYVFYFNKKYERSGPLFQNRFNSKCVENQKYFLDLCRYIHQNPEKAKICNTQDYKWSSYQEYIGKEVIIDKKVLLHYFNDSLTKFKNFNCKKQSENQLDFIEYEIRSKILDNELAELISRNFSLKNIKDFLSMPEEDFEKGIEFLKNLQYTNLRQISRVIRINYYQLKKYFNRGG